MDENFINEYISTEFKVRRIRVDLSNSFRLDWNGGDTFKSAFIDALSMSFPVGEQFFIDSVRAGMAHLDAHEEHLGLLQGLKIFIGQEATHRQIHAMYNLQLEKSGYRNVWSDRLSQRLKSTRHKLERSKTNDIHMHELAMTCGAEHLTAVLSELVLLRSGQSNDWFLNADEPLKTLWHWHCAEEVEHKSMVFDLYRQLGGQHQMRVYWFYKVLVFFIVDVSIQILNNLWRNGSIKKWRTWKEGCLFLFGRQGLIRSSWPMLMEYRRKDFHPRQLGSDLQAIQWLKSNQVAWAAVS